MADLKKLALQRKLAAAEAAGDEERAKLFRARLGETDADADAGEPVEGYETWSKDDLQTEAEARKLTVKGTGANGNVLVADLIAALEADDDAGGD